MAAPSPDIPFAGRFTPAASPAGGGPRHVRDHSSQSAKVHFGGRGTGCGDCQVPPAIHAGIREASA